MTMAEKKSDPTKEPAFQKVVQTFLNTPPKHKAERSKKAVKRPSQKPKAK
jgi:hypothetical protein